MKNTAWMVSPSRISIDGKAYWKFIDGTVLPVVSGGSDVPPTDPPAGDVLTVPGGLIQDPPVNLDPNSTTVPPAPSNGPPPRTFTAEEVERIRKEEKDKLYPRLQTMEEELKAMRQEREKETKAQQAAREKAEAEAKAKAEAEMDAKSLLAQKEEEWNNRFAALESEREKDRAVLEMERRLNALEQYKARRMAETADEIMPELRDFVGGISEEEIEQSIATAIAKTNAILANVTAHQQQERRQQPGPSVTSPPVGPLENDPAYETITADDIRNMDIATYAKNRDRLLGAASQRNNRGLLG